MYTPDFDDYISNDRNLYFDINELPFISVKNNEELISHIASFDHENYQRKLDEFLKSIGSYEDGHACERVLKLINEVALRMKGRMDDERSIKLAIQQGCLIYFMLVI